MEWNKYATPEQARSRAKVPHDNAIIAMGVASVRQVREGLDVEHVPLNENRAHSEINLPTDSVEQAQVRVLLSRIAMMILPLPC